MNLDKQATTDVVEARTRRLDLGDLGRMQAPPESPEDWPEVLTFPWFSAELRVNPAASDTAYIDLLEESGELEEEDPRAAIAVKNFIREIVHPDDFDEFWSLGKAHGYSIRQLAATAMKIVEAITGDPSQPPTGSSPGLSEIGGKSTADRYRRVRSELEAEGRPDLAQVFLETEEAGVVT